MGRQLVDLGTLYGHGWSNTNSPPYIKLYTMAAQEQSITVADSQEAQLDRGQKLRLRSPIWGSWGPMTHQRQKMWPLSSSGAVVGILTFSSDFAGENRAEQVASQQVWWPPLHSTTGQHTDAVNWKHACLYLLNWEILHCQKRQLVMINISKSSSTN